MSTPAAGARQPPEDIARALVKIGKARGPVVKERAGRNDAHGCYLGGDGAVVMGGIEAGLVGFPLLTRSSCQ
jgi:hypothetical protein